MAVITDAIIGGVAWEIFSKGYDFYSEKINNLTLRIYIAQQWRMLEQLDGVSDKEIDDATNLIETTIIKTPDEIKQIENKTEQKRQFNTYVKNVVNGNVYGVSGTVESGATLNQTFNFGDTNSPKS